MYALTNVDNCFDTPVVQKKYYEFSDELVSYALIICYCFYCFFSVEDFDRVGIVVICLYVTFFGITNYDVLPIIYFDDTTHMFISILYVSINVTYFLFCQLNILIW